MISIETTEKELCESCGSTAELRLLYDDGVTTNTCVKCSPIACLTISDVARKLRITDQQTINLCEQGELIAKQTDNGTWIILDIEDPSSSIHTLKDLINQGSMRYDYNSHIASYTGSFDYMKLLCDGQNLIYSIHGKHLPLDNIQIILPLSMIKPTHATYLSHAEIVQDPLYMEIDDELIVFLYYVMELYEKGKLQGTRITGANMIQIHTVATSRIPLPLTHPQKRIWAIEGIYNEENTGMHNIGGLVMISGQIQYNILEEAIQQFISHHDGIRIRFTEQGTQYVSEYQNVPLPSLDYSSIPLQEALNLLEIRFQSFMPMIDSPLYDIATVKLNDQRSGYLLKFHHAIADGWSIQLITDQIQNVYAALAAKKSYEIKGHSYLDYITIEQNYMNSKRAQQDKQFWHEKCADLPSRLINQPHKQLNTKGSREIFTVADDTYAQLNHFLRTDGIKASTNSFFITLFALYEWMTSNETDVIVGTPVLNRSGAKEKSMFGMFTSTMPFRYSINEEVSFSELVNNISGNLMQCYFHQRYPYDLLIRDLKAEQEFHGDLFTISVNYYNTKLASQIEQYSVTNMEFYSGHQLFPLNIIIKEWSGLQLFFDYRLDMYTTQQVHSTYRHINRIMDVSLQNPQVGIRELRDSVERK